MTQMQVLDIPADVWDALVRDAEQKNTSLNDAAVASLSRRFRVKHDPSGATFRADGSDASRLFLRVPERLRDKLRIEAARTRATIRGVVIATLAAEYGLPAPDTSRRTRS